MSITKAISKRILELCEQRKISVNKLATISCITQSTIQSIVNEDSNNPKMLTVFRICEGLDISVKEFFDDEIFNNVDLMI